MIYYKDKDTTLYNGDCLEVLKDIPDNSIDCVVTDPPYFLVDKSGKGFMNKEWDSINKTKKNLWKSEDVVKIVERFFSLLKIELKIRGGKTVQKNVNMNIEEKIMTKLNSNVSPVEKNSGDVNHKLNQSTNFVHGIAFTKQEILDLLNKKEEKILDVIKNQSEQENAWFVIPFSFLLTKKSINIVQENVLKLIIKKICKEKTIQLTLMEEVQVKSRIEGMIGKHLEEKYINVMNGNVESVELNVVEKSYSVITLNPIEKQKIIQWIISLLYVYDVIIKLKESQVNSSIYQFHKNWLKLVHNKLKPGAFAFIMSSPRQDQLSNLIKSCENAGFNTNFTSIYWTFSSGFPKATNASKLIDKRLGIDRPIISETKSGGFAHISKTNVEQDYRPDDYYRIHGNKIKSDEAQSEQAKQLTGSYLGFQPKPAVEIIIVVMKPLSEKSYIDQAINNWHGLTWLDNCRIPYISDKDKESARFGSQSDIRNNNYLTPTGVYAKNVLSSETGRFPANLICSDDILNDNIDRKGVSGGGPKKYGGGGGFDNNLNRQPVKNYYGDKGSFSRYFDLDFWFENKIKELPKNIQKTFPFIIESKPSRPEKNKGLDNLENSVGGGIKGTEDGSLKTGSGNERNNIMKNNHPTVKPIKLMSYLITLGSREGEVILDPFMGSGSTNIAAKMLNRQSIGIEKEENYIKIATERIKSVICQNKLF